MDRWKDLFDKGLVKEKKLINKELEMQMADYGADE